MSDTFFGVYVGIVESAADPEHLGRLKVRVPAIYGITGSVVGAIPVDDLPWALPMGLPAGGSSDSGGISMLPLTGDQVAIQFLDGEPEKPVWQWLMQTQDQAKKLKLHQYADKDEHGSTVTGDPNRAIISRYGHSVELAPDKVTVTTGEGYQVLLETSQSASGGRASIQTPKGQRLELDDTRGTAVLQALTVAAISAKIVALNSATSVIAKGTRFTIMAGSSLITIQDTKIAITTGSGATLVIDESGNLCAASSGGASLSLEGLKAQLAEPAGAGIVIDTGKVSVNAPQFVMNTAAASIGVGPGWPVMLLTPMAIAWILGHTHTNGNDGSPTGPPIPLDPAFPFDSVSKCFQTS